MANNILRNGCTAHNHQVLSLCVSLHIDTLKMSNWDRKRCTYNTQWTCFLVFWLLFYRYDAWWQTVQNISAVINLHAFNPFYWQTIASKLNRWSLSRCICNTFCRLYYQTRHGWCTSVAENQMRCAKEKHICFPYWFIVSDWPDWVKSIIARSVYFDQQCWVNSWINRTSKKTFENL